MTYEFTHPKTKEKYVLMKSSKNSNLLFFVKKSKLSIARKKGHILAEKPSGASVRINEKTGLPHLRY